ncbi:hypothetical protein Thpro_021242 [Acidihalobacter prosperus]|uniref:Uncharacterized protein n=1 Tax=Acidihalobacter prosperus TaxID=160660 RepID=A0A1A6C6K8_9GAMM|nr:hypothetical protein Thpro_021242 [Acidihalobacter prosperus]
MILLAGASFCLAMALPLPVLADDGLDVTISVVAPGQDVRDVIEHEIEMPAGRSDARRALAHVEGERQGSEGHADVGEAPEPPEFSGQGAGQEAGAMENHNQTQELMNQAQQSAQAPQDRELDTD